MHTHTQTIFAYNLSCTAWAKKELVYFLKMGWKEECLSREKSEKEWETKRVMVTIEKDDTEWKKDRWRKGENGRRVISSEQPCGVWSRKLARQQRKLYFTDTMRETPQWESCREHACTTLSSACRIKASAHFKIHPWKEGEGGYDLHTLNNRNKEQKTLSGEMVLMETFSTCLLTIHLKERLLFCVCPTHCWAAPGD